jgi:hypothetical protein
MRRSTLLIIAAGCLLSVSWAQMVEARTRGSRARNLRRLPVKDYVDRMKGGWIGQMAGVGWGGPTEFRYRGQIIPEDKIPQWRPEMINQFGQDDIYVEMTFLRTLELHGMDVPIRQAGIDFANSGYPLWHANNEGRTLLRSGIAPPDSGHPKFNKHADDIDYQIEADYAGLIAPGMPNVAIALGEKFGRLMNYGDGLYGGQFVGGMYAEAFFENDMEKIIQAGLACIPQESQYAECIRDLLDWYKQNPNDWEKTWQLVEKKYHEDPQYSHGLCAGPGGRDAGSIDAKLNGAYIILGLLYGKGDPDTTIVISTRCGQDSDCNPSNSGGILFTTIGYEKLPDKFKSALNPEGKFSHTPYNFPTLVAVCEKLARESVLRSGGRIEKNAAGDEVFIIPARRPRLGRPERSWEPGPAENTKFTEAEMAKITAIAGKDIQQAVEKFAPGWKAAKCGQDMDPGLYEQMLGKSNVLVTHPLNHQTACVLSNKVKVMRAGKILLRLVVGHHPEGDWTLVVKADGKELLNTTVGKETTKDGWMEAVVDLSKYGGKEVKLELLNQPSGWRYEAGYWARIELVGYDFR